jgi:hypothetical protein
MIAKDKTTPAPTDKFGRAGHDAEMQMAFYLRRAPELSPAGMPVRWIADV